MINLRAAFLLIALVVASAPGCGRAPGQDGSCQRCHASCSNGLAVTCLPMAPGGCGNQATNRFCPGGCSDAAPGECSDAPADGAAPMSCAASTTTIMAGTLGARATDGAVAVSTFFATETRVVVATSAAAVCASTSRVMADVFQGSGALLTLRLPPNFAGTVDVDTGGVAELTTWQDGALVIDHARAMGGTMSLTLEQPNGGTIGSYDLVFPSGAEQGTFMAPFCDACAQ
jgi:hypothetical protein